MRVYSMNAEQLEQFLVTSTIPSGAQEWSPIEAAMAGQVRIVDHRDPTSTLDPHKVAEYHAHAEVFFSDKARLTVEMTWMAVMIPLLALVLGDAPVFGSDDEHDDRRFKEGLNYALSHVAAIWRIGFVQAIIDWNAGRLPALIMDRADPNATASTFAQIATEQLNLDSYSVERIQQTVAWAAGCQLVAAGATHQQIETGNYEVQLARNLAGAGQKFYCTGYATALTYLAVGKVK